MTTLHMNCPYCNNLMAVNGGLLGKNVRCPHCRQVVSTQAPAAAEAIPPSTGATQPIQPLSSSTSDLSSDDDLTFEMPLEPKESHDSIFGEVADEDVFGSRPVRPEVPRDDRTVPIEPIPAEPQNEAELTSTPTELSIPSLTGAIASTPVKGSSEEPKPVKPDPVDESDLTSHRFSTGPSSHSIRKPAASRGQGVGLFTWLLLSWTVIATVAAAYFALNSSSRHPFEAIPDVYGEYEKADRKKISNTLLPSDREEVPLDLRIPLGSSLTLNQLEIQPLRVEAGTFPYFVQNGNEAPIRQKRDLSCYLLHLKLKNVSREVLFHPVDPAFNRVRPNNDSTRLYNRLTLGSAVYLGGLFLWNPRESGVIRDLIAGQEDDRLPLQPGQEREYVIPSSSIPDIKKARDAQGRANGLWRVQLRTGLVGEPPRELAVTSVVGVIFTTTDIKLSGN